MLECVVVWMMSLSRAVNSSYRKKKETHRSLQTVSCLLTRLYTYIVLEDSPRKRGASPGVELNLSKDFSDATDSLTHFTFCFFQKDEHVTMLMCDCDL
jgi:hypothetical protein